MRTVTLEGLVTGSLRLLGVYAPGEAPNPLEVTQGGLVLNDLIDDWATQGLTIPTTTRETFPLVIGQQDYTIGVGGNFNTVRPQSIDAIAVVYNIGLATEYEIPLDELTYDAYIGISVKLLQSTFPTQFYYEPTYSASVGTIFMWPIPNQATVVAVYAGRILAQFDEANPTTAVILPPAYARALRYNLALDLLPEYPRPDDSAVARIERIAKESLGNLKRQNEPVSVLDSGGDFGGSVWSLGRFLSGP